MVLLIILCIFVPVAATETAEEWNNRGAYLLSLGKFEEAIDAFNKAIELDPNCDKAYSNRGGAYFYLKYYDKSLKDFNKAIDLNPKNDANYYNRGLLYYVLKKYERAIEDYMCVRLSNPSIHQPLSIDIWIASLAEVNVV